MSRNSEPIRAAAVEVDPEYVIVDQETGVESHGWDATFTPENIERFRQGYACLHCWELQDSAFPANEKHLPGCMYEPNGIKERQTADFAEQFHGEKWVGPRTTIDEELGIAEEMRARERAERAGIVIPRGI